MFRYLSASLVALTLAFPASATDKKDVVFHPAPSAAASASHTVELSSLVELANPKVQDGALAAANAIGAEIKGIEEEAKGGCSAKCTAKVSSHVMNILLTLTAVATTVSVYYDQKDAAVPLAIITSVLSGANTGLYGIIAKLWPKSAPAPATAPAGAPATAPDAVVGKA